jgi:RNA polymerase sigma-70 factor, ECF subfamily
MDEVTRSALAARRGSRRALAEFVRLTQVEVWRTCAHLGSGADPDDLTQETYVRALGALPRFRGEASARTWLLGIARRVCADHVRRAVRGRAATARAAERPRDTDLGDEAVLTDLLAHLAEERRQAFVLTQLIGLTYAETAEVMGCAIGTVRSRVARARADLLDLVAPASGGRRSASG